MVLNYSELFNPIFPELTRSCDVVLVIPAFAEPDLPATLASVLAAERMDMHIAILVLLNEPKTVSENDRQINEATYAQLRILLTDEIRLKVLYIREIPAKQAGVGLARKIAMEEVLHWLGDEGILCNLDADSRISKNYFISVKDFFRRNAHIECASIYFEHPLNQSDPKINRAIIQYELHLRYYIAIQRYIGLPFAYQTVGSSFAIRSESYFTVGGMNKRKAGEDFYFIQKYAKKAKLTDLNTCTVFPSSRVSERVPFGTGKAIKSLLSMEDPVYCSYDPYHFRMLIPLITGVRALYSSASINTLVREWSPVLIDFLKISDFEKTIQKIRSNCTNYRNFYKAFFTWFDAFRLMKYLHYSREKTHPDLPVTDAIRKAKEELQLKTFSDDPKTLLFEMRRKASSENFYLFSEVQDELPAN